MWRKSSEEKNVKFEPFENDSLDWVNTTLAEIRNSFFFQLISSSSNMYDL